MLYNACYLVLVEYNEAVEDIVYTYTKSVEPVPEVV